MEEKVAVKAAESGVEEMVAVKAAEFGAEVRAGAAMGACPGGIPVATVATREVEGGAKRRGLLRERHSGQGGRSSGGRRRGKGEGRGGREEEGEASPADGGERLGKNNVICTEHH